MFQGFGIAGHDAHFLPITHETVSDDDELVAGLQAGEYFEAVDTTRVLEDEAGTDHVARLSDAELLRKVVCCRSRALLRCGRGLIADFSHHFQRMADHDTSSNQDHRGAHSRSERSAFDSLNERLKGGDSVAMQQLFDEYSDKLVRLASKNIHPALLKRFDGEDVVQSVFRTFFRRQQEGKFQIEREQQLWRLLVTITICKTRSAARRHLAAKRNVQVEQLLPDESDFQIREASPGDAMALLEEIDAAMQGLPDRAAEILWLFPK